MGSYTHLYFGEVQSTEQHNSEIYKKKAEEKFSSTTG